MKNARKFGIYCAALLAIIGFILLMATPALTASGYGLTVNVKGTTAIFGANGGEPIKVALVAWILSLIGLVFTLCLCAIPFIKAVKLSKNAIALCGLLVAVLFIVAGILAFCPSAEVGGMNVGAGWIIGGILFILAGLGAACDPILTLLGKK